MFALHCGVASKALSQRAAIGCKASVSLVPHECNQSCPSLVAAHCSLLTGLLVQCPLPLDPIPRRLLDPYRVAIELSHSSQNNSWTDFSKTHARRLLEKSAPVAEAFLSGFRQR